jgi:CMP/dCMP kinase
MVKNKPVELPGIKNITISGRIGTGKSTLAEHLASALGWEILDGGKIFRKLAKELGISIVEKTKIPDELDIEFEEKVKQMLIKENHHVIQSHLAGFVAQGISGVYKILVVCENDEGEDKPSIRIDRLMNRDLLSAEQAKYDLYKREEEHLKKFRRLYTKDDQVWVYWDRKYYDLVVNTFNLNKIETLDFVLKQLSLVPKEGLA